MESRAELVGNVSEGGGVDFGEGQQREHTAPKRKLEGELGEQNKKQQKCIECL